MGSRRHPVRFKRLAQALACGTMSPGAAAIQQSQEAGVSWWGPPARVDDDKAAGTTDPVVQAKAQPGPRKEAF